MSALICGSVAYDTIMVFQDQFKNHILPDKVHILNVAFHVPEMRREFGGCATNIAYNLKLLGSDPIAMATVGKDFAPYEEWMDKHGISRKHIKILDDTYTAQAFITTDIDDNQIIAFHPGAMDRAHETHVGDVQGATIGIVSPNGREAMIQHAREFAEADIPFIFDPGQGLPLFDGEDLKDFVSKATWVCVNDYESQLLEDRTGLSSEQISAQVKAYIVTRGGKGSQIFTDGQCIEIPVAKTSELADPTGCGDAFRAGLLYGLMNGLDWEKTGRIGAVMGAIKIEKHGTQNHGFNKAEFSDRYQESFGSSFE